MIAKRAYALSHLDGLRRQLMLEPRGHADMYGCFVTEAVSAGADFGVSFMQSYHVATRLTGQCQNAKLYQFSKEETWP